VSLGLRIVLGKTGVGRQACVCGKLRSGRGENSLWLEKLNIVLRAKGDLDRYQNQNHSSSITSNRLGKLPVNDY
jgi:hypothetical protein